MLIERRANAEHVPVARVAEADLILEAILIEIPEGLQVRMEIREYGEFFLQENLDDVSHGDVIRQPNGFADLREATLTAKKVEH